MGSRGVYVGINPLPLSFTLILSISLSLSPQPCPLPNHGQTLVTFPPPLSRHRPPLSPFLSLAISPSLLNGRHHAI